MRNIIWNYFYGYACMNEYLIFDWNLKKKKKTILNIVIFNQILRRNYIFSLSEIIERNSICTKRRKFKLKMSCTFIYNVKRNKRFHCWILLSNRSFLASIQIGSMFNRLFLLIKQVYPYVLDAGICSSIAATGSWIAKQACRRITATMHGRGRISLSFRFAVVPSLSMAWYS